MSMYTPAGISNLERASTVFCVGVMISINLLCVTILRAVHKYKDSREQFEQRTHKRLIDIIEPSQKTRDALTRLEMPAGVYIDIKMKNK